ncbi:MAG: response regulator transcription factor [Actinobacteria bacterium]|nr:response regulator transcription factor [Actinomycetota bacterium]MBS1882582.1 response regulator transcription factor [Actinomycetota bacterium]
MKVLLADDQAEVRSAMRALLAREEGIEVVGEAENGRSAVALARRRGVELVVMDVRMPREDGLRATRRLAGPTVEDPVAVIVVTTFDLDEYVFEALQAGASGFLLKESVPDELVPAIRAIGSGQGLIGASVTRRLIAEYASLAPPVRADPRLADLTSREHQILLLVARGLANAEIAATLVIEESTVKSHVSSLLRKLGLGSRVQAVIFAFEQGLVRVGDRAPGP